LKESPKPEEAGESLRLRASGHEGSSNENLIPSFMYLSVLALMFGLFSYYLIGSALAVVGVLFASKVENLRDQGRLSMALASSKSARIWMLSSWSFTLGSVALWYDR
jgi:hypothetical protein